VDSGCIGRCCADEDGLFQEDGPSVTVFVLKRLWLSLTVCSSRAQAERGWLWDVFASLMKVVRYGPHHDAHLGVVFSARFGLRAGWE
jgi:hypothetical protein